MKPSTAKSIILVVSGIIVAFFPGIISSLFYLIGTAVIIFCVINIIKSLVTATPVAIVPNVIGIIIGGAITSLPHFVQTIIPLTIGLILAFNGLDFIGRAVTNVGSRVVNIILAVVTLGLGCTLLFHLVKAGNATRIIAGLIMFGAGVYDFISGKNSSGGNGGIIDVDSFSVKDDNKYIR